MTTPTREQVELAERYAAALATIAELSKTVEFNEDDVEAAENYVTNLQLMPQLETQTDMPSEDWMQTVDEYVTNLQLILQLEEQADLPSEDAMNDLAQYVANLRKVRRRKQTENDGAKE